MPQRRFPLILCIVPLMWLCGCGDSMSAPPTDLGAYSRLPQGGSQSYPRQTIILFNLQRVLDKDRAPAERVESMKLVGYVGGEDAAVRNELASILNEPGSPPELQQAVLEFLMKRDYPDLAGHIARSLPNIQRGPMRDAVLDWLSRHGSDPAVLAEVVKYWAEEPSPTGPNEPRFRQVVERVSGKGWEQSLIEGLNAPAFYARGSAMEVLSRRVPLATLRQQIEATAPKSEAFLALRAFLKDFDYLPTAAMELLAVATIHKTQPYLFEDAGRIFREWQTTHGYQFNVRDFHLISRLSRDPLRKDQNMRRTQLVLELGEVLKAREHVHHRPGSPGAPDDYIDQFWSQIGSLSHTDLWNLYLLNTMLSRERVQLALRIMAARDRQDRRNAWGGLVFYRSGQAEATLYPAALEAGENDLAYVPTRTAMIEGLDSLCHFHAHFERADNAGRAGPGEAELREAKVNNYYGLILTSISDDAFCAHYYNPRGVVVSLGVLPFRK